MVEIEIHGESNLDTAHGAYMRLFSEKEHCPFEDISDFSPIDSNGQFSLTAGHILRGQSHPSHAMRPKGYWTPDQIQPLGCQWERSVPITSQTIGWKLYIDNPLEDCKAPIYVKNSVRLSLSQEKTVRGHPYQIVHVRWRVIESNGITGCSVSMNDKNRETYSIGGGNAY